MSQHRIVRHEFSASALAPDAFRVVDFDGHEAISQPYRFEVNLVSNDPEIEFTDVINAPATLTMFRGDEPTEVDGIVIDFEQSGMEHGPVDYRYRYRAVLVPRLWRLALSSQSRVFQNLTVEEIVGKILADAGVDATFALSASYEPRDYCTQYKESDLDFVQRLLEFEGIRYSFTHADGAETLHLSDDPGNAPPILGGDALPYRHSAGLLSADGDESIREFVARQQLVTGKTAVKDYNYRTPETAIEATSEINGDGAVGVHSDYGMNAGTGARASHLATVRNEEIETTRLVMTGESDCERFHAGHRFALNDHYRDSLNQTYLLTDIHHLGGQIATDADAQAGYRNSFSCVPASTPYRPPRLTPEPKLPGVLTARVESGGGEYAPIDDQGRYAVRMPFDQSDASKGQASKAIRLAQPYSGAGYGMHFPVHADAEMVFACIDGNIDRPLGLSTVPNPSQSSPVASGNRTMNRIVTASDNRIEIEDEKGNERIKLYSPHENSIIQLGSPNLPVKGIGISTDNTTQIYGGNGVVMTAGGGFVPDSSISDFKNTLTVLDGVIGVAKALSGGFKRSAAFGGGQAFVSTGFGLALPSVYISGRGGIGMYSPNGVTALAGAGGMGLHSATGLDVAAGTGISLLNGARGISLATVAGGISIKAQAGDIDIESKLSDINIKSSLLNTNIKSKSDINLESGGDLTSESKGSVSFATDDQFSVECDKDMLLDSKNGSVAIVCKKDFNLGSESDSVFIKAGGGSSSSPSIKNEGRYITNKAGSLFKVTSGSAEKSTIEVYATNINLRCGNNSIIINQTGIKIQALSIELSAKAKVALKGALNMIG